MKTDDEIRLEVKKRIVEEQKTVYLKTEMETRKRWFFEDAIKRPYFHYLQLEPAQVLGWHRYLDFEEKEGDLKRVELLYRRCLVPCVLPKLTQALYEEFWERFAKILCRWGRSQEALELLSHAQTVIPETQPTIRLVYANFLEQYGSEERSRQVFTALIEKCSEYGNRIDPSLVEGYIQFAQFECRHRNFTSAQGTFEAALENLKGSDKSNLAVLYVSYARFASVLMQDDALACSVYQRGLKACGSDNKYLCANYLLFLSAMKGSVDNLLGEFAEHLKESEMGVADKKDLLGKLKQVYVERGCMLDKVAKVEEIEATLNAAKHHLDTTNSTASKIAKLEGLQPTISDPIMNYYQNWHVK